VKGYTNIDEMLRAGLDIVDICTPPAAHKDVALKAMQAGHHVLVEKPMALTPAECDDLVDATQRHGVRLSVIHNMLFYPSVRKALADVRDGRIGDLQGVQLLLANPRSAYLDKPGWVHNLPGGLVGESGPHLVYLCQAFIGKAERVFATRRKTINHEWSRGDDYVIVLEGKRATATARLVHGSDHWHGRLEVRGSKGKVIADLHTMQYSRFHRQSSRVLDVGASAVAQVARDVTSFASMSVRYLTGGFRHAHPIQMADFVDAIRQGREPLVTPDDGRNVVHTMAGIVRELKE
jgi:predicted dehydrogenase